MFRFVVRHLRWLARIPGLPQIFDALLLSWTAIAHRPRLAAMETLEARVLVRPGVRLQVHRLGGIGFNLAGREIGHLHGNGLLDVFVGRIARDSLVAAGRAEPHHVFRDSGWVSFWLRSAGDVDDAMALLETASRFRAKEPKNGLRVSQESQ